MAGSEWENFGDEIRRTVQDAIENQDFHKLNQNITDTVDRAMGTAFHSVSNGMKNARTGQYTQPGRNGGRHRQDSFRVNGQPAGSGKGAQYSSQNQFASAGAVRRSDWVWSAKFVLLWFACRDWSEQICRLQERPAGKGTDAEPSGAV